MFHVTSESGNLAIAETWRDWFRQTMGVTTFLSIEEIVGGRKMKATASSRSWLLKALNSTLRHDGSLKLDGADAISTASRDSKAQGCGLFASHHRHGSEFFHCNRNPTRLKRINQRSASGHHRAVVGGTSTQDSDSCSCLLFRA